MRAVGFGSFGYKLTAFTLAGALAGLAGYLWGAQTGFVNPELMGFHMSAHAIMMVILGGMGNLPAPSSALLAFEFMLELFKDLPAIGDFNTGKHWQLLFEQILDRDGLDIVLLELEGEVLGATYLSVTPSTHVYYRACGFADDVKVAYLARPRS